MSRLFRFIVIASFFPAAACLSAVWPAAGQVAIAQSEVGCAQAGAAPAEHARAAPLRGRQKHRLNTGWSFRYDDPDTPGSWEEVNLPHTWNAEPPVNGEYRRGLGIYRRSLYIESSDRPRRYFLYFEGANQVADVYVNGELAGSHVGGYTAFVFDVTDLVWVGDENRIEVLVDNSHNEDIPPLNADFTFYGGLYRDVWLIETSEVHVDVLDYAGPGVYVSTPLVSDATASVTVRVRVANDADDARQVQVEIVAAGPTGQVVLCDSTNIYVPSHSVATAAFELVIDEPALWSPEQPALYQLAAQLEHDGDLIDAVRTKFGIRSVLVDGDGLYLNGLPFKLIGTNRHQDVAGVGNALTDAMHQRDMQIIRDDGFNFVRLAHYPQDPAVLHATDSLGLAVWEEIPVVNTITLSPEFSENAERMLVEMVRQHGNHPSILMWGIMNEALLRPRNPQPPGYRDSVRTLAERLHRVALREDPSRPTALAVSFHETFDGSGVSNVTDVLGLNLYFGWYYGEFSDMGQFLDSLHAAYPNRALLVSEYGAGSDERVHSDAPVAFDFSSERAVAYHRAALPQLSERKFLVGSAVWNQFDFGSAGRQDTRDGINQKGLHTYGRGRKDQGRYYRAMLVDDPVLEVERDHPVRWRRRGLNDTHDVEVYTNADSVDVSLSSTQETQSVNTLNGVATAQLELLPGNQTVFARGWWGGVAGASDSTEVTLVDPMVCTGSCTWGINVGAAYGFVDSDGRLFVPEHEFLRLAPNAFDSVAVDSVAFDSVAMDSVAVESTAVDSIAVDLTDVDSSVGVARRTHHRIGGTSDDALFQAYREWPADGALTFDLPDQGSYKTTLYFVETTDVAPGDRVFDVLINDQVVIRNLDLAAEAGRWGAVERSFEVTVTNDLSLQLELRAVSGRPVLSGILVQRL